MDDIKFDKNKFPLKNEIFLRKEELGEIIAEDRAESRKKEEVAIRRSSRWRMMRVYACCAVVIIAACIMFVTKEVTVIGSEMSDGQLVLPCGSIVKLNNDGMLSYRPYMWHVTGRKVELESGWAQFAVTKGDGFIVTTDVGDVSVLGPTFDVSVYADSMKVKCHSGRVELIPASDEGLSLVLTEGEEAVMSRGEVKKPEHKIEEKNIVEQEPNPIYYDAALLTEVVEDMEEAFGIVVVNKQLCQREKYTGIIYPEDEDLSLDMVLGACGFEYEKSGEEVTISRIR